MIPPIDAVYLVICSNPDISYGPVAIKPKIHVNETDVFKEKKCEWNDTGRGSSFSFEHFDPPFSHEEIKKKVPHKFTLIDRHGNEVTFIYLTAKLFKEHVAHLFEDAPDFDSDEAVQRHFLQMHYPRA